MYLKNYILLLVSNVICAGTLSLSQSYLAKAEKVTEQKRLVVAETNQKSIYIQSEEMYQRVIAYQMLEPEYVIEVSQRDIEALCKIVEAEAGGEDRKGKLLVANVIINRVKSDDFPDTVEQVIYQRNSKVTQFAPVADGKMESVQVSEETKEVVYSALYGEDESQGALYFMARKIANPDSVCWFDDNLTLLFSYGGHDFFV